MFSRPSPTSSFLMTSLAVAILVIGGIVLSNFQREAGVAEASAGSLAAVAAAEEAARVLEEGQSYGEFEAAMRVAVVAHDRIVLFNAVDNDVRLEIGHALDCLEMARRAWQASDAGDWVEGVHDRAGLWQAVLPAMDLGEGDTRVGPSEVISSAMSGASPHLAAAREAVGL